MLETIVRTAIRKPLFSLGRIVATPGAVEAVGGEDGLRPLLDRHICGDWGDVSEHDRAANDEDLLHGNRLLSSYKIRDGVKIWIVTERDRSATTLLLPEEY